LIGAFFVFIGCRSWEIFGTLMALSLVADCGLFSVEPTAVIAGCKISYPNRQLNLARRGCFIF
jgi:hypothetical protein